MKKVVLISIYILSLITNINAQIIKQEGYLINGNIKGIDTGTIRMVSFYSERVIDSCLIKDGKFTMQGKIGLPERMRFNISPGNWNFRAFVEDTIITYKIDTTGADYYDNTLRGGDKWSLIWEIEETGSNIAEVYSKFIRETKQKYYGSIFLYLNEKLKAVKGKQNLEFNANKEIDTLRKHYLVKKQTWIENYIRQFPSSIAGIYIFNELYQSSSHLSAEYLNSILDKFTGLATSSIYYKELTNIAINLKNTQPDSLAPDFTLLKSDKSRFTLSSIRGNYIMIDFWASWCVPCRKAIPKWKSVYSKYHKNGLVIISVSNDRVRKDWIKALDKEKMPWIQTIDEFPSKNGTGHVANLFAIKGLPYYVLMNKEGKIILSSEDEEIMIKKIENVFESQHKVK